MEEKIQSVIIDGKEYVTIKDFAKIVFRSYTTIYMKLKYGSISGRLKLDGIFWNNRQLILLSEKEKFKDIPKVGRPKRQEQEESPLTQNK